MMFAASPEIMTFSVWPQVGLQHSKPSDRRRQRGARGQRAGPTERPGGPAKRGYGTADRDAERMNLV